MWVFRLLWCVNSLSRWQLSNGLISYDSSDLSVFFILCHIDYNNTFSWIDLIWVFRVICCVNYLSHWTQGNLTFSLMDSIWVFRLLRSVNSLSDWIQEYLTDSIFFLWIFCKCVLSSISILTFSSKYSPFIAPSILRNIWFLTMMVGYLSVKDYISEVSWLNLIVGQWVVVQYQSRTLNGLIRQERQMNDRYFPATPGGKNNDKDGGKRWHYFRLNNSFISFSSVFSRPLGGKGEWRQQNIVRIKCIKLT